MPFEELYQIYALYINLFCNVCRQDLFYIDLATIYDCLHLKYP